MNIFISSFDLDDGSNDESDDDVGGDDEEDGDDDEVGDEPYFVSWNE